jgi:hypothetical protein
MKDNKEHETLSKNLLQKKDIPENKTDATEKEIIRRMSPSVVSYTKDNEEILVNRITLGQFRASNRLLQVSGRIKEMIASGELNKKEQESAENLMNETRDLIETRDTATWVSRKGVPVDFQYQSAWRLDKAWERILQLERITGDKPTPRKGL